MTPPRDTPTLREIRLVAYDPPAFDPETDPHLVYEPEARVFIPRVPGQRLPAARTIAEGQAEIAAAVFCKTVKEDLNDDRHRRVGPAATAG